ncbi:hypothetical protein B4N84_00110 [Flavobacterium sp. IR1]|nr:hypothetical protein B4N84_00110 [Flavobacterium sp. IR1]
MFGDGLDSVLQQLAHAEEGVKSALMGKVAALSIGEEAKRKLYSYLRDSQTSVREARRAHEHVQAFKETYDPLAPYRVFKAAQRRAGGR